MTRPPRPNERAMRNGHAWVDQTALLITMALEHIRTAIAECAQFTGSGDSSGASWSARSRVSARLCGGSPR